MSIEQLKESLPEYAKDIKLNLSNLFNGIEQSGLTEKQFYGIALTVSYSLKNPQLISLFQNAVQEKWGEEAGIAAKTVAALMAMNNVYYRFVHLAEDAEFNKMPANLRMSGLRTPGMDPIDVELYSIAVSAINGCGLCISSHLKQLLEHGLSRTAVQNAVRLAATLAATAQVLVIN